MVSWGKRKVKWVEAEGEVGGSGRSSGWKRKVKWVEEEGEVGGSGG